MQNGGRLSVAEDWRYPAKVDDAIWLKSSTSISFGAWKRAKFTLTPDSVGLERCERVFRSCASSLSTLEALDIAMQNDPFWRSNTSTEQVPPPSGSKDRFLDFELPMCTNLGVSLTFLPWFKHLIPNVSHLKLTITFPSNRITLVSPFEGLDLRNLRSLKLFIPIEPDTVTESNFKTGPRLHPLVFPNLQQIELSSHTVGRVQVEFILSILGLFQCDKLEDLSLAFFGIFNREIPIGTQVTLFLLVIHSSFKFLKRPLLAYGKFAFSPWDVISALFAGLQTQTQENEVILPNLKHMSIYPTNENFNEEFEPTIYELVKMLQHREAMGASMDTFEFHADCRPESSRQQILIEYFGLFVKNLYIVSL